MKKLNVKLLNRIKRHIVAEPKRYQQEIWGGKVSGRGAPACGTQGCIAGWAVFLSIPKSKWKAWIDDSWGDGPRQIWKKAARLLGVTEAERSSLFATDNQTYLSGKRGVKEACKKIDALIASRHANGDSKSEGT